MRKKALSLIIVVLMLVLMLTGCNTNELGYLNLAKELGILTQYKVDNTTNIEVSKNLTGEDLNIELNLKGEMNIEDLNSMYANLDVILKVNGIGNEQPVKIILTDNKLYVSKNAILELVRIQEIVDGKKENEKVIDHLYNVELKDTEYILAYDLSEAYNGLNNKAKYTDVYESAADYLTKAFKGFDSKLLTKINNGYKIEVTSKSAADFIVRLVDYIDKNRDLVFDETVIYFENILNDLNILEQEGITEAEKEQIINELKNSKQEFNEFVDEAVKSVGTDEFKDYSEMFEGTTIKEEIYKEGKSYIQKLRAQLTVEDVIMGTMETNTKVTPSTVERSKVTEKFISIEEFENLFDKTKNTINPVKKVKLNWYQDSYDTMAMVTKIRLDETEAEYKQYAIIENRVYLPLRYIGEAFGEEVQWDNENKKAYVIRGTEKIDMTGVLIDSTTMVKIRDFEKLGYVIEYEQIDGYSTAAIVK